MQFGLFIRFVLSSQITNLPMCTYTIYLCNCCGTQLQSALKMAELAKEAAEAADMRSDELERTLQRVADGADVRQNIKPTDGHSLHFSRTPTFGADNFSGFQSGILK